LASEDSYEGWGGYHIMEIKMETLPSYLVSLEFLFLGFLLGWAIPRGKYLKALQLRVLRSLMKFFK
jgi:hypothetical protein|tara:strand:- start:4551 stop:4748 length:198 start_codon:yes stop_codon:yes gene_type:complete